MHIVVVRCAKPRRFGNGRVQKEKAVKTQKEVGSMPILQYKCKKCGKRFEELVKSHTEKVVCPDCGGETARDYSGDMYSATGKTAKKCTGHCATCGGCR